DDFEVRAFAELVEVLACHAAGAEAGVADLAVGRSSAKVANEGGSGGGRGGGGEESATVHDEIRRQRVREKGSRRREWFPHNAPKTAGQSFRAADSLRGRWTAARSRL